MAAHHWHISFGVILTDMNGPRITAPTRLWRGGRVVECTALEMRHTCKGIVGSNPTLSAIDAKKRNFINVL